MRSVLTSALVAGVIAAVIAVPGVSSAASAHYVSPSGSDSAAGTSAAL